MNYANLVLIVLNVCAKPYEPRFILYSGSYNLYIESCNFTETINNSYNVYYIFYNGYCNFYKARNNFTDASYNFYKGLSIKQVGSYNFLLTFSKCKAAY